MAITPKSELHIFEKNTDAIGVNKGFYYQTIKILEKWLLYYVNKTKTKIYCETEDDIKSESSDGILSFSQIKCYASSFSFKSKEIKKTIFNSFSLHVKYKDTCKSFSFETNSGCNDDLLLKWSMEKGLLKSELFNECRTQIFEILSEKYIEQKDAKLLAISKKKLTLLKKKVKTGKKKEEVLLEKSKLDEDAKVIAEAYDLAMQILKNEIDNFIKKIEWHFNSTNPKEAIDEIEIRCIALIKSIDKFKGIPTLAYGRLITEIYKRSKQDLIGDRLLDENTLEQIIKESEVELQQNSDETILKHVTKEMASIHDRLDVMQDKIVKAIFDKKPPAEKSLAFEFKSEEQIDKIKNDELIHDSSKMQSNLERKIKEIQLNGEDESVIIQTATELRCSYLIYLEELRLQNLNLEYDTLKALEKKVRYECIQKVTEALMNTTFNSQEFYSSLQASLKELVKHHSKVNNIDLDEFFVFAQMYQIAAECHLKWKKEALNESK